MGSSLTRSGSSPTRTTPTPRPSIASSRTARHLARAQDRYKLRVQRKVALNRRLEFAHPTLEFEMRDEPRQFLAKHVWI